MEGICRRMSDQPKRKGLVFKGAKMEDVKQGELRVQAPSIISQEPAETKEAEEQGRIAPPPTGPSHPAPAAAATKGSRLLFGPKVAAKTQAPSGSETIKKAIPTVVAKPKKQVQILSQPSNVRLVTPIAKEAAKAAEEETAALEEVETVQSKKPVVSEALLKLKEAFDEMLELYEAATYVDLDIETYLHSGDENDGTRHYYTFLEPIDADFTDINKEFEQIEFTKEGFYIDMADEDLAGVEKIQFFQMLEKVKGPEEKPVAKPVEKAKIKTIGEIKDDETLGPLAEAILKEEGRLPGETYEEKLTDKYKIETPEDGYTPQNRRSFSSFIYQTFKPFQLPPLPKMIDPNACQTVLQSDRSEMYLYQQFVKEYMSWQTPYRGILVYHGLGSGKTCTSIAAAEALFASADKRIIVMTPFSLRQNFIGEITTCGFHHYRLKNHWEKYLVSNPLVKAFARSILKIPDSYLEKVAHIWIPDFTKESNYQTLTATQQSEVREQIQQILVYDPAKGYHGRIWFISYNGISAKELLKIACSKSDAFDNATIIVDEIHNLIRIMQGTIEPYIIELGKTAKRKIDYEPIGYQKWQPKLCPKGSDWSQFDSELKKKNYKRGYLLYRLLLQAQNSKIIGLSGTPLINFPEELGILANILHGYLQMVVGNVAKTDVREKGSDAKDEALIQKMKEILSKNLYVDFQEVAKMERTIQFRITFLPEGIRKLAGKAGVERIPFEEDAVSFEQRLASIEADFAANQIKLSSTDGTKLKVNTQPLLPPVGSEFKETFLKDDITIQNQLVLIKRLTGLISYYKGSRADLMPRVSSDEDVFVSMSSFQQTQYSKARMDEIKIEEEQEKKQKKAGEEVGGRLAALYAEVYEIKNMKQSSNYRMSSRQACNFVFPAEVNRPRPMTKAEKEADAGRDVSDIIDMQVTEGQEGETLGAALKEEQKQEEKVQEEEAAIEEEETGVAEAEEEEVAVAEEEDLFDEEAARKQAESEGYEGENIAAAVEMMRNDFVEEQKKKRAAKAVVTAEQQLCRAKRLQGETYQAQINRAKNCLATTAKSKLMMNATGLAETSPKYMKMLENIAAAKGASLVYSQFLQMEGIGIFALAMEANGYEPIEISFNWKTNQAFFSEATKASLEKGPSADPKTGIQQLRYIKFTGAEEDIVRRYSLLLFNGRFSELPRELNKTLVDAGWKNNDFGDLCRVFCITSAGAEGLSLKNIRAVHIMEPYWNDVRMAQVKGRAVRICSHAELPPEERTVDIFTYVTVFSPEAQKARDGPFRIAEKIVNRDSLAYEEAVKVGLKVPAGAVQYTLSSDERLWLISKRKKTLIDNLQLIMKSSAVDCKLNYAENQELEEAKQFKCKSFAFANVGDFMYDPDFATDIQKTRLLNEGTATTKATTAAKATTAKATTVATATTKATTVAAVKKDEYIRSKISGTIYRLKVVYDTSGMKVEKYLVYADEDKEYKTVIGEVEAMVSKKEGQEGTYVPKASSLKLF